MAISTAKAKGNREHLQRLRDKGWRKVTVWLSPEALAVLERLKAEHGSVNAGLESLK